MDDRDEHLTEEEAARLWARAAQLQAEAARRAESLDAAESDVASGPAEREGYALTHVRGAAVEAGIPGEFVDAALADLRAERAVPRGGGAISRAILRDPPGAITVRRVVEASVSDVIAAMEAVLPAEPYRLTLTDRLGDPRSGGVLAFDIAGASFSAHEGFAGEANWADLRQILISLRPIPGERPACEVTARSPVAWAHSLNAGVGGAMMAVGSGIGFAVGTALAAGTLTILGPGAGVLAGMVAATTGGAGGLAGLLTLRRIYRYSLGRGERAIDGMLAAVAVRAQGGWGLSTSPPTADEDPAALDPILRPPLAPPPP